MLVQSGNHFLRLRDIFSIIVYMNNHQRFQAFYGNNKNPGSCHGAGRMGDGYVCPKPTIGGTEPGIISKQNATCGVPVANLGRLAYCAQAQTGGGSVKGMIFTATGQLNKKKRSCSGGAHRSDMAPQQRGCGRQSPGHYPPDSHSAKFNDTANPSSLNHSGDSTVLDYPRDTCKCKSSSYCDYKNGRGTPINGYFLDIAASPIGNRPVYRTHNNMEINSPASWNGNLMDRKFDCQQPYWCEKCM